MAVDGRRCRALLARSPPGLPVSIELVKAPRFLCVARCGARSPGAITATAAITAFLCESLETLESTDYRLSWTALGTE